VLTQSPARPRPHEVFSAALAVGPNPRAALRARADVLLGLQREDEALRDLNALLQGEHSQQPGLAPLYRARAAFRAKAGKYSEAVEDYTLALVAEPGVAAAHVGRGWSYLAMDAAALAEKDFDRAIKLDAKDGDAHNGRGYALVKQGRYREAVADAEEALRQGPPQGVASQRCRHSYNAARIFAQVFLKVAEESALQNPRGRAVGLEYRDRAVQLVREAMTALPAEERGGFWSRTIQRDGALNPIRQCNSFRQLAAAYVASEADR